ncbi:MAG: histone deacetylase family protein [Planctomycetota bacterium]
MITGFADDPLFDEHKTGPGHPERPERLPAVRRATEGLDLVRIASRDATRAEVERAHDADYLDWLKSAIEKGAGSLDADTTVCAESWNAAIRAAGSALALGDAWLAGEIEAGFACLRPPGHHAERRRAMGFCLMGNISILAYALHDAGKRVAIVDWDVHHGNGTQDILWNEPEIGFLSLHQWPLYPGTGRESETGAGNIRNVPMPAGSGDAEYLAAFDSTVLPWLEERRPDVVLVSAGFDAHARDPLASQELSSEAFGEFTKKLCRWPILSLLEGGYDLVALETGVRCHLEALQRAGR